VTTCEYCRHRPKATHFPSDVFPDELLYTKSRESPAHYTPPVTSNLYDLSPVTISDGHVSSEILHPGRRGRFRMYNVTDEGTMGTQAVRLLPRLEQCPEFSQSNGWDVEKLRDYVIAEREDLRLWWDRLKGIECSAKERNNEATTSGECVRLDGRKNVGTWLASHGLNVVFTITMVVSTLCLKLAKLEGRENRTLRKIFNKQSKTGKLHEYDFWRLKGFFGKRDVRKDPFQKIEQMCHLVNAGGVCLTNRFAHLFFSGRADDRGHVSFMLVTRKA
jgi:hypothetical protein